MEENEFFTSMKLYCADFKDMQSEIESESIDLVFTDPPYPKAYLHTYQYLAEYCPRIMRYGASLVCIVAHYSIPQVIQYFDGKLKYRWMLCMNQFNGTHPRMAMGIEVMWKPMLWYVKGSYPMGRGFLRDGIEINGKEGQRKNLHKWEQDLDWCEYYIKKLTKENDTVLDPYMGSGTVAVACQKLNRRFIGSDIDENSFNITKKRIQNEISR